MTFGRIETGERCKSAVLADVNNQTSSEHQVLDNGREVLVLRSEAETDLIGMLIHCI